MNLHYKSNPSNGVHRSVVYLPEGQWVTVFDFLCNRFPHINALEWGDRIKRGRVLNDDGSLVTINQKYKSKIKVFYFREIKKETIIPFDATVLFINKHFLVADKPHFLPVTPAGKYVEQTLHARLSKQFYPLELTPLHRIDRHTAGLVLFSTNPETRSVYQALFRLRKIKKIYEAWAPPLENIQFPLIRRTCFTAGHPFFRMQENDTGEANTETYIDVLQKDKKKWKYLLQPITGKKHQLRVHLAGLGAPIIYDPFYPEVLDATNAHDNYMQPLQLLARRISFVDPMTGIFQQFSSRLSLLEN